MLVVTNRNVRKEGTSDEKAFGEDVNKKGPNELRVAIATHDDGKWTVDVIPETGKPDPVNPPSRIEFKKVRDRLLKEKRNAVLYVHGFNTPFLRSLEHGLMLQKLYGVEPIIFSWPSNPGGFKTEEYRRAKQVAKASFGAMDRVMEKLGSYLREPFNRDALQSCGIKFNMINYSLGNYLFMHYVRDAVYEGETRVFDNLVLCQADVDNKDHAFWVEAIRVGQRVYVTINENDWVLKWSDLNGQQARLGRKGRNLDADNASYFNFTDGPDVDNTHAVWREDTNKHVRKFFDLVLNGKRGEDVTGMKYDPRTNAFVF